MLGDEAGGSHDEHVVWSTAVASGGAKLVHALSVKPEEHSIIERSQPLLRGHAEQDFDEHFSELRRIGTNTFRRGFASVAGEETRKLECPARFPSCKDPARRPD
jgi:hypothetical protein